MGACGWQRGSAKELGCACSASSINEWTGERTLRDEDVPEDVRPASVQPLGNYAVQITWQDGFNQVRAAECVVCSYGVYLFSSSRMSLWVVRKRGHVWLVIVWLVCSCARFILRLGEAWWHKLHRLVEQLAINCVLPIL